ncbi:hypothetical protein [Candidatus Amarolinea aalborgensis]|jgi:tetratricopeptide (TPR) repeat protein|uniref:hypothetical protein n=1 Tax=Candidatus Amarolinea aalborgensis TaxID=2249329 RepID=UPI003BF9FA01
MSTYSEIKNKYEEDQGGMQQGLQQVSSSDSISGGVGTLIGLGIRSSRMSQQNAKIEAFNQAIKTTSAQMDQGLYEEAIATATKHLISNEIAEAKVNGYSIRGTAYYLSEQYAKAIEDLTEAIRIVETSRVQLDRDALGDAFASSYYLRGRAFNKQNQPSDALRDFTKAIQLEPGWEVLYYSRCLVLRSIGEYDRALSDINQAISIQPGDADNYRERGRLYALTGAPNKALDDFTRAITLRRSVANLRARGQFYTDQNEQTKALTDYSAALELNPNDIETLKLRAGLFKALGAHAEAEADLAHIAQSEKRQSAYQSYLDTAKAVYGKGVTKAWTEADTRSKPNYLVAILLGILTWIGISIALILAAAIGGGDEAIALPLLVGLVLAPVGGVIVAVNRIKNPKQRAKSAKQYFDEMAAAEPQMPGFTEFYRAYLSARDKGELPTLAQSTHAIFEKIAQENPNSAETWQQAKAAVSAAPPPDAHLVPGAQPNTWQCSNCGGYVRSDAKMCKHCRQPFKSTI